MPRPRSHRHDAIIGARCAGAATARLLAARGHDVLVLDRAEHDVLAVMDAVGSERAVLCGYSEGGPMALMLAAMHPERVHSLVLYGSYARRTWAADYPWAQTQGDPGWNPSPTDRFGRTPTERTRFQRAGLRHTIRGLEATIRMTPWGRASRSGRSGSDGASRLSESLLDLLEEVVGRNA